MFLLDPQLTRQQLREQRVAGRRERLALEEVVLHPVKKGACHGAEGVTDGRRCQGQRNRCDFSRLDALAAAGGAGYAIGDFGLKGEREREIVEVGAPARLAGDERY